jgi:hypothetical protein
MWDASRFPEVAAIQENLRGIGLSIESGACWRLWQTSSHKIKNIKAKPPVLPGLCS